MKWTDIWWQIDSWSLFWDFNKPKGAQLKPEKKNAAMKPIRTFVVCITEGHKDMQLNVQLTGLQHISQPRAVSHLLLCSVAPWQSPAEVCSLHSVVHASLETSASSASKQVPCWFSCSSNQKLQQLEHTRSDKNHRVTFIHFVEARSLTWQVF